MTSQSLNTVYQIDFSVLFLTVLVFFVSCFTVSQYHGRHIIINVSRSKCEYFVFSVFDMEACTFHDIILLILWDGWMVCTACYVKPCLSRLHGRDVFTTCPFWTIGPTCLLKQRYFSTGQTSCSSLYSMLYNTFFLKVVSKVDQQHTLCTIVKIGLVLRELMIEILYMMDAIWLKVLHWVWSSNLGYVI